MNDPGRVLLEYLRAFPDAERASSMFADDGVFEMTSEGLRPVPNPSQLFLAERPDNAPGSAVLCCMEGSRPLLVEVQALVSATSYGNARRMASGVDQNRLSLLLAVLEKRAGLNLMGEDVFINVAGGMTIDEPASDLAVVAAVAGDGRADGEVRHARIADHGGTAASFFVEIGAAMAA